MHNSITDLQTKGLVLMPYPADLRAAVQASIQSWRNFYSLPDSEKIALPYSNNSAGVGYELKLGVGEKADRKENFDVATSGEAWLKAHAAQIPNGTAQQFVGDALKLVALIKPTILDFAQQVETAFGLQGFVQEVAGSESAYFVRFIHYFGERQPGDETASAHTDQGGFTLHLFESDPGLQCLNYAGEWQDMPVSSEETVVIPAMQMQLRSHGALRALCHRVIATEQTARAGRSSAVCFVQLKNTAKYDKEHYGRLQEKVPGFNYSMPDEEFQKMFKK